MPKFSVVISVYNKEGLIGDTLRSVLTQTYSDYEIVVLNDGSTDGSEQEIQTFLDDPRIRFYSQENQGAAAGRNFVIRQAKAAYIAILDADDLWMPHYLEEQSRLIDKYPNQFVFATNSQVLKAGKHYSRQFSFEFKGMEDCIVDYFEASYLDSVLHSSTTVLKRDVFEETGWYDPSIKSGQDTDLYIRIGLKYPVVFSPKVCVQYKVLENSLFRSSNKLSDKPTFDAYEALEANNKGLKKFLDLGRYSLCILAKLEGNKNGFQDFYQKIDLENLNRKQRFLLKQSPGNIRRLLAVKERFARLGIRLSAFK